MSKTACRTVLLALALFLILPVAATAQAEKTSALHTSSAENKKAVKMPSKLSIQALTLVSTSEAARKAAAEVSARKMALKDSARGSGKAESKQKADSDVREFQINDTAGLNDSSNGTFHIKGHKRSVLKKIHGSVYGATASGVGRADAVDGAVGADSSNGKFSIYMQGQHSYASTPPPR